MLYALSNLLPFRHGCSALWTLHDSSWCFRGRSKKRWRHHVVEAIRKDKGKGYTPTSSAPRFAQSLRLISASACLCDILADCPKATLWSWQTHMAPLSCVSLVSESMATAAWMVYWGWRLHYILCLWEQAANYLCSWLDFIQVKKKLTFSAALWILWISFISALESKTNDSGTESWSL